MDRSHKKYLKKCPRGDLAVDAAVILDPNFTFDKTSVGRGRHTTTGCRDGEENVMTEAEMRAKVARKCTSERKGVVRIDMKEWELVRRNASNKTGWNTREVDLWAAREVEAGRMVLNKTSAGREHGVMKPLIRKDTIAGRGTSPKAEKARAMARVRKWVTKNARGKLITAAQMKTLKDNTRGRNRTASEAGERGPTVEVEAALILVAEEEAMQI